MCHKHPESLSRDLPHAPYMEDLPTVALKNCPNVGKYTSTMERRWDIPSCCSDLNLIGGLEHDFDLSIHLGLSESLLTSPHRFQTGRAQPPTSFGNQTWQASINLFLMDMSKR